MATYLTLNILFTVAVLVLLRPALNHSKKPLLATFLFLTALTILFDNVIVGLGVVDYDASKLLGIYVGVAPVEDFMYTILAVLLIPTLWNKTKVSHEK